MIRIGHARARVSGVDMSLSSSPVLGVHSVGEREGGHVHTAPTVMVTSAQASLRMRTG